MVIVTYVDESSYKDGVSLRDPSRKTYRDDETVQIWDRSAKIPRTIRARDIDHRNHMLRDERQRYFILSKK